MEIFQHGTDRGQHSIRHKHSATTEPPQNWVSFDSYRDLQKEVVQTVLWIYKEAE